MPPLSTLDAAHGRPTLDRAAIVASWRALDESVDPRAAAAIVGAVTYGGAAEVVAGLFAFDPDLVVTVDQLAHLRTVVRDHAHARGMADDDLVTLFATLDAVVDAVAKRHVAGFETSALIDDLTGLGNRRGAIADLRAAVAQATRHRRPVSIAVVDVDGLKRVNDGEGHAAGDDLLRRLAVGMRQVARQDDGVFRIGGDEFLVVARDTRPEQLELLVDRIRAVSPPFSVGVASAPPDAATADELLAVADARLYGEKRERRPAPPHSARRLLPALVLGSAAAELFRRAAGISLQKDRLLAWAMLLVALPLIIGFEADARPAWDRRLQEDRWIIGGVLLLVALLVAALVPLALIL